VYIDKFGARMRMINGNLREHGRSVLDPAREWT
jgi:hypothetical protein